MIYSSSCRYNLAEKVFQSYEKAYYNNNNLSVDTDEVIIFYFKFDENGHKKINFVGQGQNADRASNQKTLRRNLNFSLA